MRPKLAIALLSLLSLLLAGAATPATADRKPSKTEARDIYAALVDANLTCNRYPPGACKLSSRVSEENKRWAAARIRATINGESSVLPQTISLRRISRDKGRWEVIDATDGGGCNVPKRPRIDLGLVCLQFGS